jgi:hypothetical protein
MKIVRGFGFFYLSYLLKNLQFCVLITFLTSFVFCLINYLLHETSKNCIRISLFMFRAPISTKGKLEEVRRRKTRKFRQQTIGVNEASHHGFKDSMSMASRRHPQGMYTFRFPRKFLIYKYVITRQAIYVYRNNVARSHNVYTSSAILTALYDFTRTVCFYGDLMSPVTINRT